MFTRQRTDIQSRALDMHKDTKSKAMNNQARRKQFSIGWVFCKNMDERNSREVSKRRRREAMLGCPGACSPGKFLKNQAHFLHSNEF